MIGGDAIKTQENLRTTRDIDARGRRGREGEERGGEELRRWGSQRVEHGVNKHRWCESGRLNGHEQGRSWVTLRGGRRYICYRKDEIMHGICPSEKCVAPLF